MLKTVTGKSVTVYFYIIQLEHQALTDILTDAKSKRGL
jgi:hypothetical protein